MNPDHLVVALCAALAAIIGMMLLISWLLDRCANLRADRDGALVDNARLRDLVRQRGGEPPPPADGRKL